MTNIDETEFSNALFSKSNWKILRDLIEGKMSTQFKDFRVISREFPVSLSSSTETASVKRLGFADLVAVGLYKEWANLFVIEVKRRFSEKAINQVMKYVKSFWHFFALDSEFISSWVKKVMTLGFRDWKIYYEKDKIKMVPVVIAFEGNPEAVLRKKLSEKPVYIKIEKFGRVMRKIFENYHKDRLRSVLRKFPYLERVYNKFISPAQIFSETVIPYYPTLVQKTLEIKSIPVTEKTQTGRIIKKIPVERLNAQVLDSLPKRIEPEDSLSVFLKLAEIKSGEFIIQIFTNGIDKGRPTMYLQINDDEYLALQMSENKIVNWRINGIFNEFVAYDCAPLTDPIFPGSYCLLKGNFSMSRYKNTNILKLDLLAEKELNVDVNGNPCFVNSNVKLRTFIIAPKIKQIFKEDTLLQTPELIKVIREHYLLPYMDPIVVQKGISKLSAAPESIKRKIFDNELILTPLRIVKNRNIE